MTSGSSGNVIGELAQLERMSTPQLKDRWRTLVGTEPPAYSRLGLIRRLAVVIQRLKYGGLPKSVEDRLDQVLIDRGINPEDGSTFVKGNRGNHPQLGSAETPPMLGSVASCRFAET